jgi:leader peptidase (prepilin peptidase)/N-methyltransferase
LTFIAALNQLPIMGGALLAGLLGAIWGSFCAALILRWPQGRSLSGRSTCDDCGAVLRARDLLPIVSYLWLKGCCRDCGGGIDGLHRRVEIVATSIGFLSLFLMPGISGWAWAVMGWLLLPLIWLDARHFWLPDRLTMALALVGLPLGGLVSGADLTSRWVGAMLGGLALMLTAYLYRKWRGRDGMGGGDPKLIAAIGVWIGWQALPMLLLMASGAGLMWALSRAKKGDQPLSERPVPFGVFLGVGGYITAALWPLIA